MAAEPRPAERLSRNRQPGGRSGETTEFHETVDIFLTLGSAMVRAVGASAATPRRQAVQVGGDQYDACPRGWPG
jgi:hypothetical protein